MRNLSLFCVVSFAARWCHWMTPLLPARFLFFTAAEEMNNKTLAGEATLTMDDEVESYQPCYPLGNAPVCVDACYVYGCEVDGTSPSQYIDMCCPADVTTGYYTISDGSGKILNPSVTCTDLPTDCSGLESGATATKTTKFTVLCAIAGLGLGSLLVC